MPSFRLLAYMVLLTLVTPNLTAAQIVAGTSPAAAYSGTYTGTGRYVSGQGCGGTTPFPIVMEVVGDVATIPLRGAQGGLRGRVGAGGSLNALRWYGFSGVTEEARGRIEGMKFTLDYIYDYPAASHVRCNFIYEGLRVP